MLSVSFSAFCCYKQLIPLDLRLCAPGQVALSVSMCSEQWMVPSCGHLSEGCLAWPYRFDHHLPPWHVDSLSQISSTALMQGTGGWLNSQRIHVELMQNSLRGASLCQADKPFLWRTRQKYFRLASPSLSSTLLWHKSIRRQYITE